jgi:hypothetical protein
MLRWHSKRGFFLKFLILLELTLAGNLPAISQPLNVKVVPVDLGWANNSVNVAIFRKNSLVTWKATQFIAFYSPDKYVVLGKRKSDSKNWILKKTSLRGNSGDAHNIISIMADGDGFLHVAWDHHNTSLRYCRSIAPGSLELTSEMKMTGIEEQRVTYPEFYKLKNGNLIFFYRSGESGKGNLVINHYDLKTKKWSVLQEDLIDGEGERSAYWQACIDVQGTIHVAWVWRESADVSSNHDLCYARSKDGGKTWERTTGLQYQLPITAGTAEYALKIPQESELINQTSISADSAGFPFIATYWRTSGSRIPQYHVVYKNFAGWQNLELNFRKTPFTLSGTGTKRIPISRPQVIVKGSGNKVSAFLLFRDAERSSRVSVAVVSIRDKHWEIFDLTKKSVGSWEPTYDTERWKDSGVLNLFVQRVEQKDNEGKANVEPQLIEVLEWIPEFKQ